jgi:hypothetical protein
MSLLYSDVKPIAQEQNGINIYTVTAVGTYDTTATKSIAPSVVTALTAL